MTVNLGKTPYESAREVEARLVSIEAKLDQVLEFHAALAAAIEPFLAGKNVKWLALIAKAKGGRTG